MNIGGSIDEPVALELPAGFVVVDLPIAAGEDAHEVGRRAAEAAIAIVAPASTLAYEGTRPIVSSTASVSITHTRGRAIAVAGRVANIGVDLVDDSDIDRIARMAERYFTSSELALCTDELAYASVFAAKEAGLKALGLGLLDGGAFDRAWSVRVVSLDPPQIATDDVELDLVLGRASTATIAVVYR
jgi:phosphopantetheinyl transferase (holo-ACP synthase)